MSLRSHSHVKVFVVLMTASNLCIHNYIRSVNIIYKTHFIGPNMDLDHIILPLCPTTYVSDARAD